MSFYGIIKDIVPESLQIIIQNFKSRHLSAIINFLTFRCGFK